MNILTEKLPDSLTIGGRKYRIDTDYRTGIKLEQLLMDDGIPPEDKLLRAKTLYFHTIFPPTEFDEEMVAELIWFYRCGKDEKKEVKSAHDRVYDFGYDSKWIFAAFKEQYNIDLTNENMHWWEFRALFDALSEDTEFVKIMGYRAIKISGKMSTSQKRFYQKMKRMHKLPVPKEEEKRVNQIEEALMSGISLKNIL